MIDTALLHSTDELRKIIIDNPDLPLLVFAGEEANTGDCWSYMSCSRVTVCLGEVLDFDADESIPYDDRIFTERDDFAECLADVLSYDFVGTDREFEEYLEKEVEKYDPYWVKCILVYVDN